MVVHPLHEDQCEDIHCDMSSQWLCIHANVPGFAFPSGHATESLAVWGMLALLTAGMMRRHRHVPFVIAALVVALVGTSRIYLGAHWLSDVLGGYALGGLWLSLLIALMLARAKPRGGNVRIAEVVDEAA